LQKGANPLRDIEIHGFFGYALAGNAAAIVTAVAGINHHDRGLTRNFSFLGTAPLGCRSGIFLCRLAASCVSVARIWDSEGESGDR
jgi:hypothetical protein